MALRGQIRAMIPGCHFGGIIPVDDHGSWRFRSAPGPSLRRAARLFEEIGGKTIVEIGTGIHGAMSGNSMKVWTGRTSADRIIAVDLDPVRVSEVRGACGGDPRVEVHEADGIEFVRNFDGRIDLLYLDFWVPDDPGEVEGSGRARAYLHAYKSAQPALAETAIILIDDTDHVHPWKHTYIVPEARKDRFAVCYEGRQTLLLRS